MSNLMKKQLRQIYQTLNKTEVLYSNWAKSHGISYNTLNILYYLEDNNNCTQKMLVDELFLAKQTVNTILSNFIKLGYVNLITQSGKKDKIIEFTDLGKQYSHSILSKLHIIETKVLEKMGTEYTMMLIKSNDLYLEYFSEELDHE